MQLSLSVQYRLIQEEMTDLYTQLQLGYESTFSSWIENTVRKHVATFKNDAFWRDRQAKGEELRVAINEKLMEFHAECVSLQIIQVELSELRENSLIKTQIATQQERTKVKEQQAAAYRAQINLTKSQADQQIVTINGNAQADSKLILATARSERQQKTIDATNVAYKALMDTTGFNHDELNKFIYYQDLQNIDKTDVLYHSNNAFINLGKTGV